MAAIVVSNFQLRSDLLRTISVLTAPYSLRLFGNPFFPTSASVVGDFVEGPFFGYSRQDLTGQFMDPRKVRDGLYQSDSRLFRFLFADPTDTFAYGWWISNDVEVLFCGRFDAPHACGSGSPVELQISLQSLSSSVPCV